MLDQVTFDLIQQLAMASPALDASTESVTLWVDENLQNSSAAFCAYGILRG